MSWFMNFPFSHSGIVESVHGSKIYLRETSDFDVGLSLLNHYLEDPHTGFEVWSFPEIHDTVRDQMVNRSGQLDGDVYGYLQIVTLAVRCLMKRVGLKPFRNFLKIGTVCCHVVALAYQISGIREMVLDDYESEDTADLYQRVTTSGRAIKVMEKKAV